MAHPRHPLPAAAILAAALVLATLAGCSDDDAAAPTSTASTTSLTSTTATSSDVALARDVFLAGFPLVTTQRVMQFIGSLTGGANELFWVPKLSDAGSRLIVAPNRDTLYVLAVLDLRGEPQAVTMPAISDRYHTIQVLDAAGGTVTNLGTRETGGRAGTWLFVPPGPDGAPGTAGEVPDGVTVVDSPTNRLILLGRFRALGDDEVPAIRAEAADLRIEGLSALTGDAPPAEPPAPLGTQAGPITDVGRDPATYWDELEVALAAEPDLGGPRGEALAAAETLEDPEVREAAVVDGHAEIEDPENLGGLGGTVENGWIVNLDVGDAAKPRDLLAEALVARHYWGANVAAESTYAVATTDTSGTPLDGSRTIRIHLDGDALPPVGAFWSVTLYGPDNFFFDNPQRRWNISGDDRDLAFDEDGSLDLTVGPAPGPQGEGNWLPAPPGPYRLLLRLYLPGPEVLDGSWPYPELLAV